MADKTTTVAQILTSQQGKEAFINSLIDALSPALMGGRKATTSSLLTWGYYGGVLNPGAGGARVVVPDGTLTLADNTANIFVEMTTAGVVSQNTTAFTTGRYPLYQITTSGGVVTNYLDFRAMTMMLR